MLIDTSGKNLPNVLYHYSDLETLYNITISKKLWLSSIHYMSDKSELNHGIAIAQKVLSNLKKDYPLKVEFYNKFKDYLNILPALSADVFSFSLTEEGNLLSQWRGYTQKNRGISIGFDGTKLKEKASPNGIQLKKVIYDFDEKYEAIKVAVDSVVDNYSSDKGSFDSYFTAQSESLIMTLSLIKDKAFMEEKEHRLFFVGKHGDIKYRLGKVFMIPYTEMDISNLNEDGTIYKQVILGPHDYPDIASSSLLRFLGSQKACFIVVNSMVPLR